MDHPRAHPDHLFQHRIIALRSANEVSTWWLVMWIGTILALGILALAAFTIPEAFERVNRAHQEDIQQ